ncbi:O-antigen ligase family protein [Isoptericola sp. NPDC019482]|uniref:O-antigen ligase family protein n=1 Tax=Isoptericola sp. NPDC019482 TaxID=3154688 RepID=UPI00348C34E7
MSELLSDPMLVALAGAAVLLLGGLTLREPAALPVLAIPLLIVVRRVGGGGVDLSLSDFVLFCAFWVAILVGPRPFSREMRALLWLSAVYQVSTLFTVVANPFPANTVEWFHAWLSVGGAVVVGWAVGRSGYARPALTAFLGACTLLALVTCGTAAAQLLHGDTGPVYISFPYDMHKNFVGNVLAFGAVVAYVRPPWLRWPRLFTYSAFWLCAVGVVATQARQALIGLGVVVVAASLRRASGVRHSRWILVAVLPAAYYVVSLVAEQLTSTNQHNSAQQRLDWYQQSLSVWSEHEWFGVGLRWWTAGRTDFAFQPPNAELEVLTSAGTIGLLGFLVMMLGSMIVLWRVDPAYGTLALAVVAMRFVQGQFDLFWVSVQVSVPFAVAGICLGALAQTQHRAASPPARLAHRSRTAVVRQRALEQAAP